MDRKRIVQALTVAWTLLSAPAAFSGGFAVFDQSAAAIGMGGAVTALSEAPATLFYNAGGAAFLTKQDVEAGVLYRAVRNLSLEELEDPDVVAGTFGQDNPAPVLAHAFTLFPIAERLNVGVSVYSPFDLDMNHQNPDSFPGRTTAVSSTIRTLDANFTAAARFGRFGVGVGAIVRTSTFAMARRLQTQPSPNLDVVDFALMEIESDPQAGLGWNLGILHKLSERFSWGLAYRSKIKIDYGGTGKLTQIATGDDELDEALAASTPFDQDLPITTSLEFPDVASFGVGLLWTRRFYTGLDVNWTGWSSIQEIDVLVGPFPSFDDNIPMKLEDTFTYRLGAQYTSPTGFQYRFGFVFDETPQPAEMVNAFLVDTDRQIVSAGVGLDWLQVGVQWIRHVERMSTSDDLAGMLRGDTWQVSVTIKKKEKVELPDALPDFSGLGY